MKVVIQVLGLVAGNRAIRRVQLAYAAFASAEFATWIAMLVYAYDRGGVTESGVVAAAMLVPAALIAPTAASFGARFPPGHALLVGYLLQAATCIAVALAMTGTDSPYVVYPLLLGPAVAFTFTRPTQAAFAPGLARTAQELAATNVAAGWVEGISVLVAPIAAGVVLAVGSPGAVFAVMGIASALGALLVAPLRDAVAAAAPEDDEESPRGGLAVLRRDPSARLLVTLLAAHGVALGALDVLLVELAQGVLHLGGQWVGYLAGAAGIGSVAAVVVTARLVGRTQLAGPLVAAMSVWTLAFVGLAVSTGVGGAVALLIVAGGAEKTLDVTGRTLLQRVARPGLLSRIFGLLEGLQMATFAVGSLLAPALVALGGASAAFLGVGAILPLVALLTGRQLLDIDRHADVPVVEIELLRSVPMFAPLSPPTLESLARSLAPVAVAAGDDVVAEGDHGDRFYVIAGGEADVTAGDRHVATLGRSSGFGEIALMYDVTRTASVTARSDLQLFALDRETFLTTLMRNAHVHDFAHELAKTRLRETPGLEAIAQDLAG